MQIHFPRQIGGILFLAIIAGSSLTPGAVADRCNGEFSESIQECACTVHNRLQAGWSPDRVLSAYYAPDRPATPPQVAVAASVLAGRVDCPADLYFMYSQADVHALGLEEYTPALIVTRNGKTVYFYGRFFRRRR